jgi:quinol monooxygenase YgiN
MVIVTGIAEVPPDRLEDAVALSLEHVRRSRAEPGCLSHGVFQDVEDSCRLFFFECWAHPEALEAHFLVPEAREFAGALTSLSRSTPEIAIYNVPGA